MVCTVGSISLQPLLVHAASSSGGDDLGARERDEHGVGLRVVDGLRRRDHGGLGVGQGVDDGRGVVDDLSAEDGLRDGRRVGDRLHLSDSGSLKKF